MKHEEHAIFVHCMIRTFYDLYGCHTNINFVSDYHSKIVLYFLQCPIRTPLVWFQICFFSSKCSVCDFKSWDNLLIKGGWMVVCYQEGTQLRHTVGVSDRMPYQALRRKTDNGFRQDHCLSSFAINGFQQCASCGPSDKVWPQKSAFLQNSA